MDDVVLSNQKAAVRTDVVRRVVTVAGAPGRDY
jgi:hypothetical protein